MPIEASTMRILTRLACCVLLGSVIICIAAINQEVPLSSQCPSNCIVKGCSIESSHGEISQGPCFCTRNTSESVSYYCRNYMENKHTIEYRFHNDGPLIGLIFIIAPCLCLCYLRPDEGTIRVSPLDSLKMGFSSRV